jgi:hypothetical protein
VAARTTYKKRQKELARQEKQREKAARRMQRKLEKQSGVSQDSEDTLPEGVLQDSEDTMAAGPSVGSDPEPSV